MSLTHQLFMFKWVHKTEMLGFKHNMFMHNCNITCSSTVRLHHDPAKDWRWHLTTQLVSINLHAPISFATNRASMRKEKQGQQIKISIVHPLENTLTMFVRHDEHVHSHNRSNGFNGFCPWRQFLAHVSVSQHTSNTLFLVRIRKKRSNLLWPTYYSRLGIHHRHHG